MTRFTTAKPPRLNIDFRAGRIDITTEDVEETTVELYGSSDEATQAAIADTVVDQRGDEIVVRVPKRGHGLFGRTPELQLDITAPNGSRLNVKSDSGDLSVRGEAGESRIATGSGDVSVEALTGSAHVRSGSGDVHIGSATGDLSVGTGSGDMHLGALGASASLASGSGDMTVESVAGGLKAETGSGDIEVGRATDDVRAKTGSGDVAVKHLARGRLKAQAASGDLHVGVADGIPAWLDINTLTGTVSNDLEATEPVGAQEEHVRLELKTVTGDIEIARA
jgi:DUF4097 and DUF4098 domain-containing protein YvlB